MKLYAKNKKAYFNYEILEEFEAGLELLGGEVKSIRDKKISLREAFATSRKNELWLTNAHISPYGPAQTKNYEPTRPKKLLLSRKEIDRITGQLSTAGQTMVPLKVYDKRGKIKVLLGLARGKKKHDKRETIKRKDLRREAERDLKELRHQNE